MILIGSLSALNSTPLKANEIKANEINVAFSVFPPLINQDAFNHPDGPGVLVEFYQNVLPKISYKPKYLQLPPKRIYSLMAKGETVDLYSCADHTKGKRPHFVFAPGFTNVTVQLFQNPKMAKLKSVKDVIGQTIIKQHGFSGLKRLLDPSNTYLNSHASGVAYMFAHGRAPYLLGFKERIEAMLKKEKGMPQYREYPIRTFHGHICLHKRFKNAQQRVNDLHTAMLDFQDTKKGESIFKKYGFTGRFGPYFQTASDK